MKSTSMKEPRKYAMGQYYTPSNVADLIISLAVPTDALTVLDPAAGEGIFLKRLIARISDAHHPPKCSPKVRLIGVEIDTDVSNRLKSEMKNAGLLESELHCLQIMAESFFKLGTNRHRTQVQATLVDVENEFSEKALTHNALPAFSAIIGNPPYTRHEDISLGFSMTEKRDLHRVIQAEFPELHIKTTMGLHGFFSLHSLALLEANGGRLGFVLPRSWMDTKYGEALKKALIENTKITHIITSDERWFEDAQMLPCILIAETCTDHAVRSNNPVAFVHLKTTLKQMVKNPRFEAPSYWESLDKLVRDLQVCQNHAVGIRFFGSDLLCCEDSSKRIVSVRQDSIKKDTKWSKFLSFPSGLFHILEECRRFLVPLGTIAEIRRGVTTGANNFFLFPNSDFSIQVNHKKIHLVSTATESRAFSISKRFFKPAVTSIRNHEAISIRNVGNYILTIPPDISDQLELNRDLSKYVKMGETKTVSVRRGLKQTQERTVGYHTLSTLRARSPWYSIPRHKPPAILVPNVVFNRHIVFRNHAGAIPTNICFEVHPMDGIEHNTLACVMNSTIAALAFEMMGRYVENQDATITSQIMAYLLRQVPVIDPRLLDNLQDVLLQSFERTSGLKVPTIIDRRENDFMLNEDEVILHDLVGLTDNDIYTVRSELACVVESRMNKRR